MSATMTQPASTEVHQPDATEEEPSSATFFNSLVGFTEAVRITGKNKSTVSRDTQTGKLPHELGEQGQKRYKVSDLYLVYGLQQPKEPSLRNSKQPTEKPDETSIELALLRQQVQMQGDQLHRAEDEIRDLRQHRDKLTDQNQRLTLMLTGTTPQPAEATPANLPPAPAPKTFWQRIIGK